MTADGPAVARPRVITPASACVEWVGRLGAGGYGLDRGRPAHRVAWLAAGHALPPGYHIHHRCGNRACVNVDHLECLPAREHGRRHAPAAERSLRELRLASGIGIRDLAKEAGIDKALISQIERGRLAPTRGELERLGAALGVVLESKLMVVEVAS